MTQMWILSKIKNLDWFIVTGNKWLFISGYAKKQKANT